MTKPDDTIEIFWLKPEMHERLLGPMTNLLKKCKRLEVPGSLAEPSSAVGLMKAIRDKNNQVRVVEDSAGNLLGYTIYRGFDDQHEMHVIKTVIDPDALETRPTLAQSIVHDMCIRLREDCAHSIHYLVDIDNVPLQKALKEEGFVAPADIKQAIVRDYDGKDGRAVRLQRHLVREGNKSLMLYTPQEYEEPKSRYELLKRMLDRLETVTHEPWELAQGPSPQQAKAVELTHMVSDDPDLYLRTGKPVENADHKQDVLERFFARSPKRNPLAKADATPKQLVVPADWVRSIHLRKATEVRTLPGYDDGPASSSSVVGM